MAWWWLARVRAWSSLRDRVARTPTRARVATVRPSATELMCIQLPAKMMTTAAVAATAGRTNPGARASSSDAAGTHPLPDGEGQQEQRRHPAGVEDGPRLVGAGGVLEEVDGVPDGQDQAPGDEQEQADRPPGHDHQGPEGEGEQDEVADRVRQVHGHRGRRSADRVDDGVEDEGGADGGGAEPGNGPVEPGAGLEGPHLAPHDQHDAQIGERVHDQVEGVGRRRRRGRSPALGLEGEDAVADGPGQEAQSESQPDRPARAPHQEPRTGTAGPRTARRRPRSSCRATSRTGRCVGTGAWRCRRPATARPRSRRSPRPAACAGRVPRSRGGGAGPAQSPR